MIAKRSFLVLFALVIAAAIIVQNRWQLAEASSENNSPAKSASTKRGKRAQAAPTFNKEVVRIFQQNCQTCHHSGDIAPFSLMTYKDARPWAAAIREQVILKKMPPWKPAPGCGDFRDARGLTQEEINAIVAWVDGGAPEGNAADLPAPLEFPDGWSLGAPDLVVQSDVDYTPPTQGDMYRCFSVPTSGLRGDRWIGAVTVKPGNAKIVHHVIAYGDPNGESAALDAKDPGPGYTCFGGPGISATDLLGGWAPGSRGYFAPEGTGIKLSNNSRVIIQIHYHPTGQTAGQTEIDRTPVGIYFAKAPVQRQLQAMLLVNTSFAIPPGAKNHEVTASLTVPPLFSAKMWAVTPHMHLLGKKIKLELTKPGATTPDCLIDVPDWNFNWQGTYLYKNPIEVPGGSRLRLTCNFDNSTDNPLNPNNPPKTVRWGEETTDEMAVAFIGFTLDQAPLPLSAPALSEAIVDGSGNLVASGNGFLAGADIEINGRSLRDTTAEQTNRLSSSELWKVYAAPGQEVSVTVLNPDGVRTPALKFTRPGSARALAAVSAASFSADALAPEAIAAAFGTGLATTTTVASSTPLPTELAGTKVRVNGVLAPLFFVSSTQINFLVPAGVLTGGAVVEIVSGDSALSRGAINLASVAPSLFTSSASGTGAPAALVTKDGVNFTAAGNPDGSPNPIDAGDYLVLFGSGFRRASAAAINITIGGRLAPILFAGAQDGFAGLDQINTQIPTGISGVVDLVFSINGKVANVVKVRVR
ncbi:MAG: c-type cytochrome [Blastocatellia bacterium]